MKHIFTFILITFMTTLSSYAQAPKTGETAPDFTAKDQDGKEITLSKLKGKKVVLYFYPKDDTPGCTSEACNLRDNYAELQKAGYVILGVSADDETSHKNFQQKYALPFSLLADTDKAINKKYRVWVEKERDGQKYFGTARTTFIIDEKGIVTQIIDKVETASHSQQIIPDLGK